MRRLRCKRTADSVANVIIVLTALCRMACGEAVDTLPGQPVAHRRAAFKKILLDFELIGIQLREKQYHLNWHICQARHLAGLRNDPWPLWSTGNSNRCVAVVGRNTVTDCK